MSDALGFRVVATNLPEQVKPVEIPDAPEVAAAKARLFALQEEHIAKLRMAPEEMKEESKEEVKDETKADLDAMATTITPAADEAKPSEI